MSMKLSQRVNDGKKPIARQRRQREYRHTNWHVLNELWHGAQKSTPRPTVHRVHDWRKRHRYQDYQQISQRQRQDVRVWYIPHGSVAHKNDDERPISDGADNEYYAKYEGYNVRLRTTIVRRVVGDIRMHVEFAGVFDYVWRHERYSRRLCVSRD